MDPSCALSHLGLMAIVAIIVGDWATLSPVTLQVVCSSVPQIPSGLPFISPCLHLKTHYSNLTGNSEEVRRAKCDLQAAAFFCLQTPGRSWLIFPDLIFSQTSCPWPISQPRERRNISRSLHTASHMGSRVNSWMSVVCGFCAHVLPAPTHLLGGIRLK